MTTAPPTLEGHDHARRPRPGLVEGRTALVTGDAGRRVAAEVIDQHGYGRATHLAPDRHGAAILTADGRCGTAKDVDHMRRHLGRPSRLLAGETRNGHLPVVPAGGWGRGQSRPAFDQHPAVSAAAATRARRRRWR